MALKGFAKFFKELAEEENEHAQKLIEYQNLRGGRVVFSEIARPSEQEWSSPLVAIEFALNLEKNVNQVDYMSYLKPAFFPAIKLLLKLHFVNFSFI